MLYVNFGENLLKYMIWPLKSWKITFLTCQVHFTLFVVNASHTITFPSLNTEENWIIMDTTTAFFASFPKLCDYERKWVGLICDLQTDLRGADDSPLVFTPVQTQDFISMAFQSSSGLHDKLTQSLSLLRHLMYWWEPQH